MKALQEIITTWKQLQEQKQTAALATLVKVEGVGSISGGCPERDVKARSQQVLNKV